MQMERPLEGLRYNSKKGPGASPAPLHAAARLAAVGVADWDVAHATADLAGVSIVALTELADAERTRDVIEAVWGDAQEIPRELIRALQLAGTVLLGGEADGELVGFVLGFPGISGGLHLHSHMLGVVPSWQARGVGYALKLAQRAACLDAGIAEIRWTYDPLVYRNARFNLVKLRARGIRFLPAFYGEMTDRLNRGDRSDRFEVSWRLSSDAGTRAIELRRSRRGEAFRPAADHDAGFDATSDIGLVLRGEGDAPVPRPARV